MAKNVNSRTWAPSDLMAFGVLLAVVGGVALGVAIGQASEEPICFSGAYGSTSCSDTPDPALAFVIASVSLFASQLLLLAGVIGAGVRIGIREAVRAGTLPPPSVTGL